MRAWKTLARRVVFAHLPWLEVSVEKIELPDGRVIDEFPAVRTRDFAIVVAFTDDERIVMERSYKHGTKRVALSVPAGIIEDGEDPLAAAKRELREETGYEANAWTSLGSWAVDGNYRLCVEHAFMARHARKVGDAIADDLEEIRVELHTIAEARAALDAGEIAQLSTAAAIASALLRI